MTGLTPIPNQRDDPDRKPRRVRLCDALVLRAVVDHDDLEPDLRMRLLCLAKRFETRSEQLRVFVARDENTQIDQAEPPSDGPRPLLVAAIVRQPVCALERAIARRAACSARSTERLRRQR